MAQQMTDQNPLMAFSSQQAPGSHKGDEPIEGTPCGPYRDYRLVYFWSSSNDTPNNDPDEYSTSVLFLLADTWYRSQLWQWGCQHSQHTSSYRIGSRHPRHQTSLHSHEPWEEDRFVLVLCPKVLHSEHSQFSSPMGADPFLGAAPRQCASVFRDLDVPLPLPLLKLPRFRGFSLPFGIFCRNGALDSKCSSVNY